MFHSDHLCVIGLIDMGIYGNLNFAKPDYGFENSGFIKILK